jgi:hypothetical protein
MIQLVNRSTPAPNSAGGDVNVSAHNLMTLIKRTSPNVYEADIFNSSRQRRKRYLLQGARPNQVRRIGSAGAAEFRQRHVGRYVVED